jgi:N-acetylmuramoyl-L-alanine amidase
MIFISAGHHLKDPGAVANGVQENQLTIILRDLVTKALTKMGAKFKVDNDTETLAAYLGRIKTGTGSVICELHFNASAGKAEGIEVIIPERNTADERALAAAICDAGHATMGLLYRGVIDETKSARKRLGLMRKEGINVLVEVCFITNKSDLKKYESGKALFAQKLAELLKKYDDLHQ